MQVLPQSDGSLKISEPQKTAGFDLGNRSLFVKSNGHGDVNQIYFAHGAHAGCWKLNLLVNGSKVEFDSARAIGRQWQLFAHLEGATVEAEVFLQEKTPAVYQTLSVTASEAKALDVELSLVIDITAPPPPKGAWQNFVATYLPRIPRHA